ncbi:MAG: sigma-70 family RNA polymerase sigma factor [Saprospiraceae bacterium]|nr:sigma-70 family RNA polymerase sigma factor [Saprospiraceae bacterium]
MKEDLNNWKLLKEGNSEALRDIYNLYYSALMNYGLRLTPSRDVVEDCIHDLFTDIWRLRGTLGDTDSIKNYLIGSLRRRIIKSAGQKNAKNHELTDQFDKADESANFEMAFIQGETDREMQIKLKTALGLLTKRQQEAIYLKYSEGLDYEQICSTMDLQYQSVRNLISTAILRLKEHFGILLCLIAGF